MTIPFTVDAPAAIRYECTAEPLEICCHCRDCQRATGSAYYTGLLVPNDAFKLTQGEPTYYAVTADSGRTLRRGFCATCGSPVLILIGTQPFCSIVAASLDDPSWFLRQFDIFISDEKPWDQMNPTLPKFEQYSPPYDPK
jgi:hypothetical protein